MFAVAVAVAVELPSVIVIVFGPCRMKELSPEGKCYTVAQSRSPVLGIVVVVDRKVTAIAFVVGTASHSLGD